ncbi:MAG: hypothetical protein DIU71_09175 [Proteobacteria bacterium]|nr:MAG: hypothetical protein DIU71_09175 [Pseudomonadota bacterium]
MARAVATRSSDLPKDAIALLKNDHRTIEQLFDEFERTEEDSELSHLAERICQLLNVHAQIEEELFYPQVRAAFEEEAGEEAVELVDEAAVEHDTVKSLIARIESMTPDDQGFRPTVKVLGEYVKHHVREEEREIFPKLRSARVDVKQMGTALADRKHALMEELGVPEEETRAAAPARRKRAKTTARARGRKATGRAATASRQRARANGGRTARH